MNEINTLSFKIYIDADACPTKIETITIATRHNITVHIVSNGGIRPSTNPLVKTIVVNSGPDKADNWIVDHILRNDIVITSDIPLADQSLKKGAYVISHSGETIDEKNIGLKIASRNLMSDIRSADPFHRAKGKEYSKSDRIRYMNSLERIIQTIKKSL